MFLSVNVSLRRFLLLMILLLVPIACGLLLAFFLLRDDGGSRVEVEASDLLLLFHRTSEPLTTLRGLNRDTLFDIPREYLPEDYRRSYDLQLASIANSSVAIRRVPIKKIPIQEDLFDTLSVVPVDVLFIPNRLDYGVVTDQFFRFFMAQDTIHDFLSAAVWARLHFNPDMVLEAVREAILMRPDTQGLQIYEFPQYTVDQYVDETFYHKAREAMWLHPDDPSERDVIPVIRSNTAERAGADGGPSENDLWYFREDLGLTLFHAHWHLIYPYSGDINWINKDRRGELFTYIHRQLIARYNANRFGVKMDAVEPLRFKQPVKQGYFPKMRQMLTSSCYTQRPSNTILQGEMEPQIRGWIAAVEKAIREGQAVMPNGTIVPLRGPEGVDIVEDMIEGSPLLSPNYDLYGNIHNTMHGLVSVSTNPLDLYDETRRLVVTLYALRDPAFYNIHRFVDDLYEEYKQTLQPYVKTDLEFRDIAVTSLCVESVKSETANELHTFYLETDLDVSIGLEFTAPGSLFARFKRLVHEPFQYRIQVKNTGSQAHVGMVRLFLLIQTDGKDQPIDLRSMQRWAIELDKFKALIAPGESEIVRSSIESSVSIDPDRVYQRAKTLKEIRAVNHCRCGFPMSLLIPRGTVKGQTFKVFAMITDYEQDGMDPSEDEICREGWVLCGARESKYPDRRPMGFPFDRKFDSPVKSLDDFLTSNMATQDVTIKFHDRVQSPSGLLPGGMSTSWNP